MLQLDQIDLQTGKHKTFESTRKDVEAIVTPQSTATWQPIGHGDLVYEVLTAAEKVGYQLKKESYGLNATGNRLFAVIDFTSDDNHGHGFSVGLRNSHDKTMAFGICAGCRIFVCDNLCLDGDYVEKRKHTTGVNFSSLVQTAFQYIPANLERLSKNLERLKTEGLSDDEARLLVFKAMEHDAIAPSKIKPIWEEYCNPTYEKFSEPTKYNLLMAFTEVAKEQTSVASLERMYLRSAPLFGLNSK